MKLGCVKLMRGRRGKRGMTLLEVVIALTVFMVASAGICTLITQSKRLSDSARDHYIAINIAKNRLEFARFLPISVLSDRLTTNQEIVNVDGEIETNAMFMRSTVVTQKTANLKEVIVTVAIRNRYTWEFGTGTNAVKEVLRTYFTPIYDPAKPL